MDSVMKGLMGQYPQNFWARAAPAGVARQYISQCFQKLKCSCALVINLRCFTRINRCVVALFALYTDDVILIDSGRCVSSYLDSKSAKYDQKVLFTSI